MKKEKAITLISLVITILVLIILAGIAINLSISENGIFNRAKQAKQHYEIAVNEEEILLSNASNEIDSYIDSNKEISQQMKIDSFIVQPYETGTGSYGKLTIDVRNYNKLIFGTLDMASTNYNRLYVWDANDPKLMNEECEILTLMSERDGESGIFENMELDVNQYDYINIWLESGRGDTVYIENITLK